MIPKFRIVKVMAPNIASLNKDIQKLNEQIAEISVVDISNYAATLMKTSYQYTGKAIKPGVKVSGLTAADYTVAYKNNTAIGKATVTITGKKANNFKGTITKTFKITKKTNTLKVSYKTATVKYKKLKKGTYKVKVKVKAKGNANYKASAWKTVTFKVRIK